METDGQRLYSVLTTKEVGEKMMQEIDQISEFFSLSKSDATIILIHLRWNSFQASDRLGDDKEKFMEKLGLVKVSDMSEENESVSCFADHKTLGDGDSLLSTPFCSHKVCTTCWIGHLNETLKKKNNEEEGVVQVLCPKPDCAAPVGPDTIEKLTGPVKEMYESYVLVSFMESNKESIKWCPAPGCDYAVERHEDVLEDDDESCVDIGVVCVCGHTFCWSCKLESHRPVTCKNAYVWYNRILDVLKNAAWVVKNTKPCPRCNSPVERNGDPHLRIVTCICSCSFCWLCFRSEEQHNRKWKCVEVAVPPSGETYRQAHYLSMWESCHEELEKSQIDLKDMEENVIRRLTDDFSVSQEDIWALKEAWLLMIQCRLVLKWSCAFEYSMTACQSANKPYLVDQLRGDATKVLLNHKETLEEVMELAISSGDFSFFKLKLSASTTLTGHHFHNFVKSLEDDLPEVKV